MTVARGALAVPPEPELQLQPYVPTAAQQIAVIARANLGRAENLLAVKQSVVFIWRSLRIWHPRTRNCTSVPSNNGQLFHYPDRPELADGATLRSCIQQTSASGKCDQSGRSPMTVSGAANIAKRAQYFTR